MPFCSEIGRPSIDPELMLRMLIVGYCYGRPKFFLDSAYQQYTLETLLIQGALTDRLLNLRLS